MNVLDFFKRNSDRWRGKPDEPTEEELLKHHGPFNPFGDPPGTGPFAGVNASTEGPCLRCGEWGTRNQFMFCLPCWTFSADLARWALEKKAEDIKATGLDPTGLEVGVSDWAYVFAAKWPRDPGPDPKAPTFPDTIVEVGSYWQEEGPKPDNGRIKGICSCHHYRWN